MKKQFIQTLVTLLILLIGSTIAYAQTPVLEDHWWVPNGTVYTIARNANTVYIGGEFTMVGPNEPNGAKIDATTGIADYSYLNPNGQVNAAIPDGSGGWYIGGNFTKIGGQTRNFIARINSDGTLNAWNPGANSYVLALAKNGNTIYVGGYFTTIGGQSRTRLAALDATTGNATFWNPNANGAVLTLAVANNIVYAGGVFNQVGGQLHQHIVAIDEATGDPNLWSFTITNQTVRSLALIGNTLYIGGDFTNVNGQTRNRLAALDATNGTLLPWNPNADNAVYALVANGNSIYAGGIFNIINGVMTSKLAALDATTGAVIWHSGISGSIYALAINGNNLYAAGDFNMAGGQTRTRLASFDAITGNVTTWNPVASNSVQALGASGNAVYAGGLFNSIGGVARNYIAALDAITGQPTAWNPNANYYVESLALNGSNVYAGGEFTSIGGQTRSRIAALDASTGNATAWNPNANNFVWSLAINGSTIYAAGGFTTIGGQTRNRIAALDLTTGNASAWNPNANGDIYALALSGSTVYVGGNFTNVGGQARNYVAALDASTGNATAWNPNANNYLRALLVTGSTVFAGGHFTSIGGQTRNRIAAIDASLGTAAAWNPNANAPVFKLALNGSTLYAAGGFTNIGGQWRTCVAALDATTGNATSWNPEIEGGVAYTMAVTGASIHIGGAFTTSNAQIRNNFAVFSYPTITTSAISPTTLCAGQSVNVPFTTTGTFTSGNVFTAQLSNSSGSFSSPTNIGTLSGTGSGTITATIPYGLAGSGYRIRVVGSNPATIGTDNGSNITIQAAYKATFTAMNTGSATWCPGETRNVTVTVTNSGCATWTNASPDVNIAVTWDGGSYQRVDANGLAPGASQTYTFSVTAPVTAGTNHLTFDVVKEGDCWFGNNNGSCGPGNAVYVSAALTISKISTVAPVTGANTLCVGQTTTFSTPLPTGGTLVTSGGYRRHRYTTVGNSTFSVPAGITNLYADVLVVGGGGGGGSNRGGGGGGGACTQASNYLLSGGSTTNLSVAGGGMGSATPSLRGVNGGVSSFATLVANGGGGGGSHINPANASVSNGAGGTSGGGAAMNFGSNIFSGGAGTAGQGNTGGSSGQQGTDNPRNTGGGGGAGGVGITGVGTTTPPNGGAGIASSISGALLYYGGGGGGASGCAGGESFSTAGRGLGGNGGGGNGAQTGGAGGSAGAANTGGGGGGGNAGNSSTHQNGFEGGSGIVIVAYLNGTWSSSNTSVAIVNSTTGLVTAVAPGTATISYTITNASGCTSSAGKTITITSNQWYLDADADGYYTSTQTTCTSPGAGWTQTVIASGDCAPSDNTKWQSATLYVDADGDGYNNGTQTVCYGAAVPSGFSLTTMGSDCYDLDASVHAPQTWYLDADNDGYYTSTTFQCIKPGPTYNNTATTFGDCAPSDAAKWQSGTLYIDADNDGYDGGTTVVCYGAVIPSGYKASTLGSDCNDNNASVNVPVIPSLTISATQLNVCAGTTQLFSVDAISYAGTSPVYSWFKNNVDQNIHTDNFNYNTSANGDQWYCVMTSNDICALPATVNSNTITVGVTASLNWYLDADNDGHYTSGPITQCSSPGVGYNTSATVSGDCDDADNTKWQSALLYIDADNDNYDNGTAVVCYGAGIPTGYKATTLGSDCNDNDNTQHATFSFYADTDGDSYGAGSSVSVCAINAGIPPNGYSLNNTDCAPSDITKWQSATLYIDADNDNYDNGTAVVCYGASIPTGYKASTLGSDCNDNNASVHPGATEVCGDGLDNDCTGGDLSCTPPGTYTWTGSTSNDWTVSTNWIPTSGAGGPNSCSETVIIPSSPIGGQFPQLNQAKTIGYVTTGNGATLNLGSSGVLNICNHWTGASGSAATVSGAGKVELNGTAAQTISGNVNFENLSINKNSGLTTITGNVGIVTSLVLTKGNLTNSGTVTLKSDSSTTAYLDNFTSGTAGSYSGNLTVERYVSNAADGYRDISSPVNTKVSDLNDDFAVFGPNGVHCWYAYNPYPNVQYYNESNNAVTNNYYGGFWSYTGLNNTLTAMKGIAIRTYEGAPFTLDFTGAPYNGSKSIPISFTNTGNVAADGWNLVGNCYPSPILWNKVKLANPSELGATYYVFQTTGEYAGSWGSSNGSTTVNGATNEIASSQGFWVLASGNSNLDMNNGVRTASASTQFFKTNEVQPDEIRLSLSRDNYRDEIVTYSDPNATADYDFDYDGLKMTGGTSAYISFTRGGKEYAINVVNEITETSELPLTLWAQESGLYTISATELNLNGLSAYLKDSEAHTVTELTHNITVPLTGGQICANRYSVVFKQAAATGINTVAENNIRIYSYNNTIVVERPSNSTATINVNNVLGQQIMTVNTNSERTELPLTAGEPWYAFVKVTEGNKVSIAKVLIKNK